MNDRKTEQPPSDESPLTFWQVIGSTFAAAIGVQTKANKVRDFSRGKPIHFIIAGIAFTAVFVLTVVVIVRLVLSSVSP